MDRNASRFVRTLSFILLVSLGYGMAPAARADDGVIVLTREVQPRTATRPIVAPDPNPRTANANTSPAVDRAVNAFELGDSDFARVTSGSGLQRQILPDGQLPGVGISGASAAQGLPGLSAGRSGSAGSGISNQVNRSLQQGLAPLKMLSGDR